MLHRDERKARTAGYYAAFVSLGLATVLGPTLPGLAEHTGSQLSAISFVFTATAFGYLVGSLLGGRMYDRVPGHLVMVLCLILTALMLGLIPLMQWLWLLALVVFVLGMAGGALDVGGNTLLVWVHGSEVGPLMNGLHFCFGLGSLWAPIIVTQAVLMTGDITWAYWTLALLQLPVAAWLLRVPSPAIQDHRVVKAGEPRAPAHTLTGMRARVVVVLIALLLFLYVGAEVSFGGWIFTYAVTLDLASPTVAGYLTSAFWGALTLGRLLGIPIASWLRPSWVMLGDLAGCLVSAGVFLLWPYSSTAVWLGAVGMGLFMASIFPTVVSWAERRLTITGQTTGWFLVGASIGGMTWPWLIGQLFEGIGPRSMIIVVAVALGLALAVFGALMLYSARHRQAPPIVPHREGIV